MVAGTPFGDVHGVVRAGGGGVTKISREVDKKKFPSALNDSGSDDTVVGARTEGSRPSCGP